MDAFYGGAWRSPQRCEVLINGAWRRLTRAEVYRSGAWRTFLSYVPALSASVSPSAVAGDAMQAGTATAYSGPVTASPNGGQPPYSYAWTMISGGAAATNTGNATTQFSQPVPMGSSYDSIARVTVTDAFGATATADVNIYLTNSGRGDVPFL